MKSILISIKPQWVAKILSGEKTIEIRKTAPKCELPVTVYIYCTKTIKPVSRYDWGEFTFNDLPKLGKVVAKFTLLRADEFDMGNPYEEPTSRFLKKACVTIGQARTYANGKRRLYAWRIYNLVVFDKPKELSEFYSTRLDKDITKLFDNSIQLSNGEWVKRLDKVPQSWCYVEEEEK